VAGAEGCHGFVRRSARGPATALWPFNFPLNLLTHKIGPALASAVRSSSATQRHAAHGPPPGSVPARGSTGIGTAQRHGGLSRLQPRRSRAVDRRPARRALSFTGSDSVGWELKRRAYKKQVMLELGGQASMIVEADAPDLAFAAKRAALAAFAYAGQVCISLQRLYVQRQVWDKFMALFLKEVAALKTGDPRDSAVTVGPVIDDAAAQRIAAWVEEAVARKAKLLCGERLAPRLFSPHVLEASSKARSCTAERSSARW